MISVLVRVARDEVNVDPHRTEEDMHIFDMLFTQDWDSGLTEINIPNWGPLHDVAVAMSGCFYLDELQETGVLPRANLNGEDLSGLNLENAALVGASLRKSNLTLSNLEHAWLLGADLTGANLCGANLRHATLEQCILTDACLEGADLTGAERLEDPPPGWQILNEKLIRVGLCPHCGESLEEAWEEDS